jgi:hypothetical protein
VRCIGSERVFASARAPKSVWVLAALATSCAPLASFRPASGLSDGRSLEAGVGVAAVSPRTYVTESWAAADQIWLTGEPKRWLSLSAIGVFDDTTASAGGASRFYLVRVPWYALGAEVEAGYGWLGASLPIAYRIFDWAWFYTAPRVGNWGSDLIVGVLGGLDLHVSGGLILRTEAQASWQELEFYNRRNHVGLALAVQW